MDNPPEVTFLSLTSAAVIVRIRFDEGTNLPNLVLLRALRKTQKISFWKGTGLSPYLRAIELFWSLDEIPAPRRGLLPPSVSIVQRRQLALSGAPLARAIFLDWLSAGPTYDQNWELAGVKPARIPYVLLCDPTYHRKAQEEMSKKQRSLEMPDPDSAARLLLAGCRDQLASLTQLDSQDLLALTHDQLAESGLKHPDLFAALREPPLHLLRCDTWLPPDPRRPLDLSAPAVQVWNLDDRETQLALASSATHFLVCFQHDRLKALLAQCVEACRQGSCTLVVLSHQVEPALVNKLRAKLKAELEDRANRLTIHVVNPSKTRELVEIRKEILASLGSLYLPTKRVQQLAERLASRQTNGLGSDLQDLVPSLLSAGLVGQIPGELDLYTDSLELLVAWDSKYSNSASQLGSEEAEAREEEEAEAETGKAGGLATEVDLREESFVFAQPPTQAQHRLLRRLLSNLGPITISDKLLRVPHQAAFRTNSVLAAPAFASCAGVPASSAGFAQLLEAEYKRALPPPRPLPFFVLVDDRAELATDRLAGLSSIRGLCLPSPNRPAQCFLWRPAEQDESFWALDPRDLARRFSVECRAGDSSFLVEITPNPSQRHPNTATYVTVFGHALREATPPKAGSLEGEVCFLPEFRYDEAKGWSAAPALVDYSQVPLPEREEANPATPKIGLLTAEEAVELAVRRVGELTAGRKVAGEQLLRPKTDAAELQAQRARADNSLTTVAVLVLFLCFALAPVVLLGVASYWIPVLLLLQELLAILGGLLFVLGDVFVRFSHELFRERSRRSLQLKSVSSVLLSVCAGLNVAIIAMAFTS